ncbi:MAG: DUF2029 domain-containing protein [Oligoflexia bacterium]|nr:DUF2029 domain-containing protein [Oligoflexia bacterium]
MNHLLKKTIIKKIIPTFLILYSLFHIYSTGIKTALQLKDGGDFAVAYPSWLAFNVNPMQVWHNSGSWMGYINSTNDKTILDNIDIATNPVLSFLKEAYPSVMSKTHDPNVLNLKNKNWHNGPVMHFVTYPLLFFKTYMDAFRVWFVVCFSFLILSFYLWYKLLFIEEKLHSYINFSLCFFIWFNFFPLYEAIILRVIDIFQFLMLTLFFYYFKKEKPLQSGITLGIAALTKFTPLIFIPYLIVKKKFKLFFSALATIAIIAIFTQFFLGWENSYLLKILKGVGAGITFYESQSISSWSSRLFSEITLDINNPAAVAIPKVLYPKLAEYLSKAVTFSIVIFYGIIFLYNRKSNKYSYEISLLLIFMIILPQWNHPCYFIAILPPFLILLQNFVKDFHNFHNVKKFAKVQLSLFLVSFLLLGVVFPMSFFQQMLNRYSISYIGFYQSYSIPVYGYMLLIGLLTFKYLKKTENT